MNFKWLSLFISISVLSLYDAASTAVHSNAYDNLLRTYNSERTAADYHEKIYEILAGSQGFSDKPATPAQLSNIVYITVHAALNSKEPDKFFLQKTLKENQSLINMPSLSEERKKDRIYHYGILMVIYAATKLSQQDGNIFTLPERVQNYLKNLAEDSILTGVLAQPLKDILSGVNKDGIAQILVGYKFTNVYHSVSSNAGGLMLDGAAVVDYTHSGITTRDSSPNVTPSSSTGNMASVRNSDVPADIAHLDPKYIKKLKMMSFISETPGNKLSRQAVIDKYTKEQESEKAATLTTSAGGGGDRSALFSQLNGGAFSLKKAGSSAKDKGGAFNPKDARKVRLNKSPTIPVTRDESSITKEIEKLESEIVELQLQLVELDASKASSGSTEKIERQIVGKTKLIEGKQQAIRDKIKERGLLIGKKKNESGTKSASEGVTGASLTSMSPPIVETGSASPSPSFIPLGQPEVLLAAPASPPIIVARSKVLPPPIASNSSIAKVDPVPTAPALPKKPLKIVATGSIFADLSMSHAGALRKVGDASSKTTGVKKTLDATAVEEEINKHNVKITELQLEIDNLEASKAVAGTDLEREKIEKKIIAKRNLIEGKELALKKRQEELDKISSKSLTSQLALRARKTHGDDAGTDSDDDGWDPDDD